MGFLHHRDPICKNIFLTTRDIIPMSADTTSDCPFCAPEFRSSAFADDGCFMALHNIAPVLPGHSLVVPRRHAASLLDLDDDELCAMMRFARDATRLLARAFAADGFDWTIQDGAAAGQTVRHLHLHVIPRLAGDFPDPGDWYPRLMASRAAPIDSRDRLRMTGSDHARVTERLRSMLQSGLSD